MLSKSSPGSQFAILYAYVWEGWQEQSLWKGDGLPTQEPTAPLLTGNREWATWLRLAPVSLNQPGTPGGEKRDHFSNICRERLWTAIRLPWKPMVGNRFHFKKIATNNNKHK